MTENNEVVIYCWPYTPLAEVKDPKKSKPSTDFDPVLLVCALAILGWVLAVLFSLHIKFYSYNIYFLKALPLMVLPLFSMRRGITHIRMNRFGLVLQSSSGKRVVSEKKLSWSSIRRIYLEEAEAGKNPLSAKIVLKMNNGWSKKIPLKKIATAGEWRKLVAAFEQFKTAPDMVELDPAYLDSVSALSADDPGYTRLWLDALTAPPRQERLLPLSSGTELQAGRFEILKKLGCGGQGSAYLASSGGQELVLKEYILPVYVDRLVRKQALESFHHEASTLAALDDEHVVKMIDSFVEDQRAYLVLEYVAGKSLRQLVKENGALPESQSIELALQMCQALRCLHNHVPAIVHQDFTPDNLIVDSAGKLKLIDFMVAKEADNDSSSNSVVGKHHYMPPEQFRGKASTQSDLYAFGATLYYMLTGKDPEPMAPAHPILLNENVSGPLDELVAKATQLDCHKRYKNVAEIEHDLGTVWPVSHLSLADTETEVEFVGSDNDH